MLDVIESIGGSSLLPPCRPGSYPTRMSALASESIPVMVIFFQFLSGRRHSHFSGLSLSIWIMLPMEASPLGATMGFSAASTAFVASAHAPLRSCLRENCLAHACSSRAEASS